MFLQPSEIGFLKHLKEARVPLEEFEFPSNKISNIQNQLEKLIGQNYYLNRVSLASDLLFLEAHSHIGVVCQRRIPFIPASVRIP